MNYIYSDFINNIFFILFPLFLHQIFSYNQRKPLFQSNQLVLTSLLALSIFLCIQFPFMLVSDGFQFDLRQIPLIVGTIYGGLPIGLPLVVFAILFRIIVGGTGIILATVNTVFIFLFILLLRKKYFSCKPHKRMAFIWMLHLVLFSINVFLALLVFKSEMNNYVVPLLTVFSVQGLFTCLTALFIERMIKNQFLQERMVTSEKQELVSHLSASISHELRNPLQVIKGVIQLLRQYKYDKRKRDEFYQLIISEVDSSEKIINNYLGFAKKSDDEKKVLEVQEIIEEIYTLLTSYARQRNIHIELSKNSTSGKILGNHQQFKQVIINLGRNAIEAMEDGGLLSFDSKVESDKVIIHVNDTGVGMTEEQMNRLGEPYFSTKETGTGLGMLVVYSIIKGMKGKIKVESTLGGGTTFKLILPLHIQNAPNEVSIS